MSVPDLLTVEEAARVLRIGRSSAYELAGRDLASDGAEGLPVVRVGRLLRIPRAGLENFSATPITVIPADPSPTGPTPSSARKARPHLRAIHDDASTGHPTAATTSPPRPQ